MTEEKAAQADLITVGSTETAEPAAKAEVAVVKSKRLKQKRGEEKKQEKEDGEKKKKKEEAAAAAAPPPEDEDDVCKVCGLTTMAGKDEAMTDVLICDGCDKEFHLACSGLSEMPGEREGYNCGCNRKKAAKRRRSQIQRKDDEEEEERRHSEAAEAEMFVVVATVSAIGEMSKAERLRRQQRVVYDEGFKSRREAMEKARKVRDSSANFSGGSLNFGRRPPPWTFDNAVIDVMTRSEIKLITTAETSYLEAAEKLKGKTLQRDEAKSTWERKKAISTGKVRYSFPSASAEDLKADLEVLVNPDGTFDKPKGGEGVRSVRILLASSSSSSTTAVKDNSEEPTLKKKKGRPASSKSKEEEEEESVAKAVLAILASSKELEEVHLHRMPTPAALLAKIAETLPTLKLLSLCYCRLEPADLKALSAFKDCKVLDLRGSIDLAPGAVSNSEEGDIEEYLSKTTVEAPEEDDGDKKKQKKKRSRKKMPYSKPFLELITAMSSLTEVELEGVSDYGALHSALNDSCFTEASKRGIKVKLGLLKHL